jgi:hypothetical protein
MGRNIDRSGLGLLGGTSPNFFLKGLKKITINFSDDNRSVGLDPYSGPPEKETGFLTNEPR